ncbi:MAG: metallophosphoesterase [Gemmatimonadota bacterium]|nr:metallophosphoesterase [Gemmatimonadota bacterium]
MTRILHVSDLHFGRPAVLTQIDAIERAIAKQSFDVVAASGDFSQRARAGEFQRAAVFLRDARKFCPVITVPGNHDVAWWFAPVGVGDDAKVYQNYREYISEDLEPTLRVEGAYLVGLNTAHGVTARTLTLNPRDISIIGDLTPRQVEHARQRFEQAPDGDAKVVVMHHNPVAGELSQRSGLKHTSRLLNAFAEMGVELILCGHDHQEAVNFIEHPRNGVIVSTAGTVSNRSRGGRPSSYNVITIEPQSITVVTFIWNGEEGPGEFLPGPQRCFDR